MGSAQTHLKQNQSLWYQPPIPLPDQQEMSTPVRAVCAATIKGPSDSYRSGGTQRISGSMNVWPSGFFTLIGRSTGFLIIETSA